jgi:uncharacterized protein YgbK (DUF1537 family)
VADPCSTRYQSQPLSRLEENPVPAELARQMEQQYWLAAAGQQKLVLVLDDDPTGIQTVHGVYVYTGREEEVLEEIFRHPNRLAYLQTNSRSLAEGEAAAISRLITQRALAASKATGRDFVVISRSDSSLRGHYPAEPLAIRQALEAGGYRVDGEILCFFLPEAGRCTLDNIHYITGPDAAGKEQLVPVSRTEFARDAVFSYTHSDLRCYIGEKTGGLVQPHEVESIPLGWLRQADMSPVSGKLMSLTDYRRLVVNCLTYGDLKRFVTALWQAQAAGKRFVFRSAAGLVKILGGIPDRELLSGPDLALLLKGENATDPDPAAGVLAAGVLTVAGSHTEKTTRQLEALLALAGTMPLEVDVERLLDDKEKEPLISAAVKFAGDALRQGLHPVVYTSRKVVLAGGGEGEENLRLSRLISGCLSEIVRRLTVRPRAVIAKGGITSSDIAVKGLGVNKALIIGQLRPSIALVQTGKESRFPGLPLVIFPGNTGTDSDLAAVWQLLAGEPADGG